MFSKNFDNPFDKMIVTGTLEYQLMPDYLGTALAEGLMHICIIMKYMPNMFIIHMSILQSNKMNTYLLMNHFKK